MSSVRYHLHFILLLVPSMLGANSICCLASVLLRLTKWRYMHRARQSDKGNKSIGM